MAYLLLQLIYNIFDNFRSYFTRLYQKYKFKQKRLRWEPQNGAILSNFECTQLRDDLRIENSYASNIIENYYQKILFAQVSMAEMIEKAPLTIKFNCIKEGLLNSIIFQLGHWCRFVPELNPLIDRLDLAFDENYFARIINSISDREKERFYDLFSKELEAIQALDKIKYFELKTLLFRAQLEILNFIYDKVKLDQYLPDDDENELCFVLEHKIKFAQMMVLVLERNKIMLGRRKIITIYFYKKPKNYIY